MTIWTPERVGTLQEIAATLPGRDVVVIGAIGLAHHFGQLRRETLDLDLCVAMPLPAAWRLSDE